MDSSSFDPTANVTGWSLRVSDIGIYGTDYEARAIVAAIGLGANIPKDAAYG